MGRSVFPPKAIFVSKWHETHRLGKNCARWWIRPVALYVQQRMAIVHRGSGALVGRMPDRTYDLEPDHSLEWVPERKLHTTYKTDGVDSRHVQVSVPSDDHAV